MYKVIAFSRVSSLKQDYERQEKELRELIISEGFSENEIYTISYKESAIKLDEAKRKGIQELYNALDLYPSIKIVYTYELSRLSRRDDVSFTVLQKFLDNKIQLVIKEPQLIRLLDKNGNPDPMASLVIKFLSWFSAQEMSVKKARMMSGRKNSKSQGKVVSASTKFGYRKNKDGYAEIDPETSQTVKDIFSDYIDSGLSTQVIADKYKNLGKLKFFETTSKVKKDTSWRMTIRRILHDKTYCGKNPNLPDAYPAFIEESRIDKAIELLSQAIQRPKVKVKNIYYCKGILKVGARTMTPKLCDSSYSFKEGKLSCSLNINLVDSGIWMITEKEYSKILRANKDISKYADKISETKVIIGNLTGDLKKLEKSYDTITDLVISGRIPREEGDRRWDKIKKEIEETKSKISGLQGQLSSMESLDKKENDIWTKLEGLDKATDDMRASIIKEVIESVSVEKISKGHYKITPKFSIKCINPKEDQYFEYKSSGCKASITLYVGGVEINNIPIIRNFKSKR